MAAAIGHLPRSAATQHLLAPQQAGAAAPNFDQMIEKMVLQDVVQAMRDKEGRMLSAAQSGAIAKNYKLSRQEMAGLTARAEAMLQTPAEVEALDQYIDTISEEDRRKIVTLIEARKPPVEESEIEQIVNKVILLRVIEALQIQNEGLRQGQLQNIAYSFHILIPEMESTISTGKDLMKDQAKFVDLRKDVDQIFADQRNDVRIQSHLHEREVVAREMKIAQIRAIDGVKEMLRKNIHAGFCDEDFARMKEEIKNGDDSDSRKEVLLGDVDHFHGIFRQVQAERPVRDSGDIRNLATVNERELTDTNTRFKLFQQRWHELFGLIFPKEKGMGGKRKWDAQGNRRLPRPEAFTKWSGAKKARIFAPAPSDRPMPKKAPGAQLVVDPTL